jgi:SEC-C motif
VTSRNAPCVCGSSKRFKQCCGTLKISGDSSRRVSDEQLIDALKEADDEGIRLGREPSARSLQNIGDALRNFGYHSFILMGRGAPEIVQRAHKLNDLLFVPKELQTGGMHLGAFLFRDMFCQLYAPIAFGTARIDFFKMVDLSDFQKRWLADMPDELAMFIDQASDILDFGYGFSEFGHGRQLDPRGGDLIWRAHVQLEAAAATATSAYDYRGTVQSSLLGTELALKAGLAALGVSDAELRSKKIGHDLVATATRLGNLVPAFDVNRVVRVVSTFPDFVASRYNAPSPSRVETGHILMGAQYVASEVTRQFSDRNGRLNNPDSEPRVYPA